MTWVVFSLGALALVAGPVRLTADVAGSTLSEIWALFQLITTTCLALTVVYGPGLAWWQRRARTPADLALAIVPGPLALGALGLICWLLGQWADPVQVARAGIALMLAWLAWRGWRDRAAARPPAAAMAVVAAGALVVGFAVAKANFSTGPAGELYGGTISRTLEVGGHADSRISFHVVQLVANNFPPFSSRGAPARWQRFADAVALWAPNAPPYFAPWTFASRGPVAGLAASPIVLATGAAVPESFPDQRWQPFDPEGFAAYRIALIVMASLTALAVFGATAAAASAPWPLVAAAVTLLSPFFVHELYFTWPKLAAAGFVLASFVLARRGRGLAAGLMLAFGYLFHPLAILSVPVVGLWTLVGGGAPLARLRTAALFAAGVLLLAAPWILAGIFGTGSAESQGGFLTYFQMADRQPNVSWTVWRHDRWQSFANTFIPFHLLTVDQTNHSINALGRLSDRWVHAGFLYWNTLPFALGLPAFLLLAAGVASACRRAFGATLLTVIGPALFLTAYWGDSNVGLMRFCGHVLFVSVVVLGVWAIAGWPERWRRPALTAFFHPACFAWRAVEIGVMAFGTTLLARRSDAGGPFVVNDLASLVAAAACLTAAVVLLYDAVRREMIASMPTVASA